MLWVVSVQCQHTSLVLSFILLILVLEWIKLMLAEYCTGILRLQHMEQNQHNTCSVTKNCTSVYMLYYMSYLSTILDTISTNQHAHLALILGSIPMWHINNEDEHVTADYTTPVTSISCR